MTETILIAGCGDLGVRTAKRLLAQGHTVWGLRRHPPAHTEAPGLRWVTADLARPDTLHALPADITRLLYVGSPGARDEAAYRTAFIAGLQHVLSALSRAPLTRVVFVSSSAVYGEHDGAWVDERTATAPLAFNGRVLCEAEAWLAAQPVPSVSLRLAGLYGPGRLHLLERLRTGRARAPRAPMHWANRMHIDDAAAAAALLLTAPKAEPLYVGADDTPLPLHTLYDHLAEAIGAPAVGEGSAPMAVGSKRLSNARLKAAGLALRWPDAREGYAALIAATRGGTG